MIDSVAAGILLEIVFGGRVSRRFRWSLNPDVLHQDGECIGIVLREMLAQDATDSFRHVVDRLPSISVRTSETKADTPNSG
jgi:hypothetical protein